MPLQVRDDHLLHHYDDLDDVGDHCDLEDLGIMVNLHIIQILLEERDNIIINHLN